MTTIAEKFAAAFAAAEKLNAILWQHGVDSAAMSVEAFAEHVSQEYGIDIEFRVIDVETKYVLGYVERYDNGKRAIIYLVEPIGSRWRRLVGVKELCQLVLDSEDEFSTDAKDTLARLVTPTREIDRDENMVVRSEYTAEALAYELIYPHEYRKADKARLEAGDVTVAELGARYGIPGRVVEDVLADPYIQFADRWWHVVRAMKQAAQ